MSIIEDGRRILGALGVDGDAEAAAARMLASIALDMGANHAREAWLSAMQELGDGVQSFLTMILERAAAKPLQTWG